MGFVVLEYILLCKIFRLFSLGLVSTLLLTAYYGKQCRSPTEIS